MTLNDLKWLKMALNGIKQLRMTRNDVNDLNEQNDLKCKVLPTDGWRDGPTDGAGYRVACTRVKRVLFNIYPSCFQQGQHL